MLNTSKHWKVVEKNLLTTHHTPANCGTNAFDLPLRAVRNPGGGGGTTLLDKPGGGEGTSGINIGAVLLSLFRVSNSILPANMGIAGTYSTPGTKAGAAALSSSEKQGAAELSSDGDGDICNSLSESSPSEIIEFARVSSSVSPTELGVFSGDNSHRFASGFVGFTTSAHERLVDGSSAVDGSSRPGGGAMFANSKAAGRDSPTSMVFTEDFILRIW